MNDDYRRAQMAELQFALKIAIQALDELEARLPGKTVSPPSASFEDTRFVDRIATAISKSRGGNECWGAFAVGDGQLFWFLT
jgi:hypothetical protein